jgi:hypothetical protein
VFKKVPAIFQRHLLTLENSPSYFPTVDSTLEKAIEKSEI